MVVINPHAVCPGGEGAALKAVGRKRLAGSNPVYGAILLIEEFLEYDYFNYWRCSSVGQSTSLTNWES